MSQYKPWWEQEFNKFSTLGSGRPSNSWIQQALIQDAIHGRPGVLSSYSPAKLTRSVLELIQELEFLGGRLVFNGIPPAIYPDSHKEYLYVWPDACFQFDIDEDQDVSLYYSSTDPKLFDRLHALAKSCSKPRNGNGKVFVVLSTDKGPKIVAAGAAGEDLIEGNYTPEVVQEFHHVAEDLKVDSPCGRVVIFDGIPGSGKTYCIRGLMKAVENAVFVMVPPDMVSQLGSPSLVGALISAREEHKDSPTVLVIEDADKCLVSRGPDNMGSISALLNLSDGILGATLKLRIVATTNAGHLEDDSELDPALLRPGRLCRRIHVGALAPERASAVHERLTGKSTTFTKPMTVAEVYRLARDAGWKPKVVRSKSVGFKSGPEFFE